MVAWGSSLPSQKIKAVERLIFKNHVNRAINYFNRTLTAVLMEISFVVCYRCKESSNDAAERADNDGEVIMPWQRMCFKNGITTSSKTE